MANAAKRAWDKDFSQCHAPEIARELLGKRLCRKREDGTIVRLRITVTEAYEGDDTACYGVEYVEGECTYKRTAANAPLFEPGGAWCVYGGMLLLACGEKGVPENVLIREAGTEEQYCNGPVQLCRYLGLDSNAVRGKNAASTDFLWLEDDGVARECCAVQRIGLGKAVLDKDRKRKNRFISL